MCFPEEIVLTGWEFGDEVFTCVIGMGFYFYLWLIGLIGGENCTGDGCSGFGCYCSADFGVGGAEVYYFAGEEVAADEVGVGEAQGVDHAVHYLFEVYGFDFFELGAETFKCLATGDDCLAGVLHAETVEGDGLLKVGDVGVVVAVGLGCCAVGEGLVMDCLADVVYFFFLFCGHGIEGIVYFGAECIVFLCGGIGADCACAFGGDVLHGYADVVGICGGSCGFFEGCLGVGIDEDEFVLKCGEVGGEHGDGCGGCGIACAPEEGGAEHVGGVGVAFLHYLFCDWVIL